MKTKTINLIGAVILIIETLLQSIGVLNLSPEVLKYTIVSLAFAGLILNGVKTHFSAMNAVVWINIIAFVLYVLGGVADVLDLAPFAEEVKVSILKVSGLLYMILNIIARSLFKLDYSSLNSK